MTQPTPARSWVASANGHADFPLQNLPLGIFSRNGEPPRSGVAIGDFILDLHATLDAFDGEARRAVEATAGGQLNGLFALGRGPGRTTRSVDRRQSLPRHDGLRRRMRLMSREDPG